MPRVFFLLLLAAVSCTAAAGAQPASPQNPSSPARASDVRQLFASALSLQNQGRIDRAAALYQQLIAQHPELPEPRNNLALIYMKQGKYDDAIDVLVATLNTHPAYATAWKNLKSLYQGLASEAYRKALSKESDSKKQNSRSVMDKIQLTALTRLYNTPAQQPPALVIARADAIQPPRPAAPRKAAPPKAAKRAMPAPESTVSKPAHMTPKPLAQTAPKARIKITPRPQMPNEQDLIAQIKHWAQAWSNKDFEQYVDAYLPDYKDGKRSHRAWLEYRRSRIIRPGFIRVQVDRFKVKSASARRAIIDFRQRFSSPNYKDRVIKRIYLSKTDQGWKISREKTLSVL